MLSKAHLTSHSRVWFEVGYHIIVVIWVMKIFYISFFCEFLPPLLNIFCFVTATAKSLQSCSTLCDPIDVSPPGSPAPGILQARTLEWVAISFSNASKWKSESKVAQSCPTLRDPMDCSLTGSSIHGIFQARVLEWGAIAFSYQNDLINHNPKNKTAYDSGEVC